MTVTYPITAIAANKVTVIVSTCLLFLASLAVGLRMWSRHLGSMSLGSDDYLILFSLFLLYFVYLVPLLYMVYGMGIHTSELPVENVQIILKLTIAYQIIYGTSLAAIKLSYLTFFCRVFKIRADFMRWAYCLIAMVISWWIANTLQTLLICRPFAKSWDPTIPGQCGNEILAYVMVAVFNITTDVAMLLLPMPFIGALQMKKKKKFVLVLMFSVGLFITAISAVRLAAMLQIDMTDFSWGMLTSIRWTIVETSVAVMNACFPMLRPLMHRLVPKIFSSMGDTTPSNSYPSRSRDPDRSGNRRVVRSSIEDDEIELTAPEKNPAASTRSVADSQGTEEGSYGP